MKETVFAPQRAVLTRDADGVQRLTSALPLGDSARRVGDWIDRWAAETPSTTFIAERSAAGWRRLSYGELGSLVPVRGATLLGLGLGPDRPLMLLSGKSVEHALLALSAQYVGIPTVAVAEQYSQIAAAHDKLKHVLEVVRPGAVFIEDTNAFAPALASGLLDRIPVLSADGDGGLRLTDLDWGDAGVDVAAARDAVGPDTLAKLLFTSGSTSMPKAVRTTHRMLTVNQTQIAQVWPFLTRRPQRIVDWLPWNHTFGGSHNFNLMLANGGTLFLDDGQPTAKGIARTIENIRLAGQTVSFNVPIAYSMMAEVMRNDAAFRAKFFRDLDLIFYAAASMPQAVWDALKTQALAETGREPAMSASWGMTETAPAGLMVHGPMPQAGAVGIPLPGMEAKLLPVGESTFELRVKGPNVTDGYYNAPDKSAESFDAEGYLITGDVVRFADPEDASAGLIYDGRLAEDFKLLTGTWVQVSRLRTKAISAFGPVARDMVICGHGRQELGALVFADPAFLDAQGWDIAQQDGALMHPALDQALRAGMDRLAAEGGGSSMRIERCLVLADPPSAAAGEITQKGNLNQKLLLERRARWVERLYDDRDPALIRIKETAT